MKSVLIFTCFFFMYQCGTEEDFRRLDSLRPENPCSYAGGNCIFAAECPTDMLTKQRGLCPTQQRFGVECCYTFSVKETRCQKHGGSCIEQNVFCNKHLIYEEATDCEKGKKCCILV